MSCSILRDQYKRQVQVVRNREQDLERLEREWDMLEKEKEQWIAEIDILQRAFDAQACGSGISLEYDAWGMGLLP